jgi:hypothetical protein
MIQGLIKLLQLRSTRHHVLLHEERGLKGNVPAEEDDKGSCMSGL